MQQAEIGRIMNYYSKIGVAVLRLERPLWVGDRIHIAGHTTEFSQAVASMEIEHDRVDFAMPGDNVALKVEGRVRPGDKIFLEARHAEQPEKPRLQIA